MVKISYNDHELSLKDLEYYNMKLMWYYLLRISSSYRSEFMSSWFHVFFTHDLLILHIGCVVLCDLPTCISILVHENMLSYKLHFMINPIISFAFLNQRFSAIPLLFITWLMRMCMLSIPSMHSLMGRYIFFCMEI